MLQGLSVIDSVARCHYVERGALGFELASGPLGFEHAPAWLPQRLKLGFLAISNGEA